MVSNVRNDILIELSAVYQAIDDVCTTEMAIAIRRQKGTILRK